MALGDTDTEGGYNGPMSRDWNGGGATGGDYNGPGFGPNGEQLDQTDAETARLNRLNTDELGNPGLGGISPGSTLNRGFLESLFSPGSMAYRLGMRMPGTTADQMFDTETEAERMDRLGLIGNAVDATFGTIARAAVPAPVSLAMGLYNGYQDYTQNQDMRSALSKALGGQRGLLGAIGSAAQGNYGNAVANALGGQTNPMSAALAGIGVDAVQGKNVQRSLGGLFGGYAGSRLGGPIGGVIGSRAGRSLSSLF